MSKVRIGFVGVGGMGQVAHLINYSQLTDDCEVVALAELRPELGKKVAARYGIPGVYTNHKDMVAKEKLDGIVAIQQFQTHGQLIPQLLEYGIPVITEKPLASTIAGGERILKSATAGKGKLYVGYHKRSDLASLYLKQQIAAWQKSHAFGKMTHVRVVMPPGDWVGNGYFPCISSEEKYPDIQKDGPESPDAQFSQQYDSFVNYYIHQINLTRYLLGEAYSLDYVGKSGTIAAGKSVSGVEVTMELGTFTTTIDWQEEAFVAFQNGWMKLQLPCPLTITQPGKATIHESPQNTPEQSKTYSPTLPRIHAMRSQAASFIKAVRGDPTHLCSPQDALEDLKVARRYVEIRDANK